MGHKKILTVSKGICPKLHITELLGSELTYFEIAVQYSSNYATLWICVLCVHILKYTQVFLFIEGKVWSNFVSLWICVCEFPIGVAPTHTHTHTHTHTPIQTHIHTHPYTHTHIHTHILRVLFCFFPSLFFIFSFPSSLSLSLLLSPSHSLSLCIRTYAWIYTYVYTHKYVFPNVLNGFNVFENVFDPTNTLNVSAFIFYLCVQVCMCLRVCC